MHASFIGGIIAVVVILLIIAVIKTYNHMVVLRNRVDNQGAQIEVQLKHRSPPSLHCSYPFTVSKKTLGS